MRIRLKVHRKFHAENIFLFIAIMCVTSFAILEYMSISIPLFTLVKNPLLYIGGACIMTQLNLLCKTFKKKKYLYLWIVMFVFCTLLFISAYQNKNPRIGEFPIRGTVRTVLYLLELYALMIWVAEKRHLKFLINFLFYYVLILLIVTDTFLLTGIVRFYDGRHESYLVGTKFIVSYLHMDFLMLWLLKRNDRNAIRNIPVWVLIAAAIFLIAISVRVQCMTGVLGCVVLMICYVMIDRPSRKGLGALNSPIILVSALAVNLIFPFVSELIISIPFVKYFVVEVLGRSENLTGRIEIFQIFSEKMEGHWLFGFGFGNENLAARELFGYANAQHSVLQWILRAGLLNTLMLSVIMIIIFQRRAAYKQLRQTMPIVILIYVYIFLGMVEITFSMSFIMWVFILYALVCEKPEQEIGGTPEKLT